MIRRRMKSRVSRSEGPIEPDYPRPDGLHPPVLLRDAGRCDRPDPLAQRRVADARVDARLVWPRAALAEARRADDAPAAEHRAARVALAGVRAALREAGADHGACVEVPVRAGAVGVGRDRDVGFLEVVRRVAALAGGAPPDDRLARPRRPQPGLTRARH